MAGVKCTELPNDQEPRFLLFARRNPSQPEHNTCSSVSHESAVSARRQVVLVVDTAASEGGALSILNDFLNYVSSHDAGVDWVVITSIDQPRRAPWVRVEVDRRPKRSLLRRALWELVQVQRYIRSYRPDVVFSLQNTAVMRCPVPQVIYVHQPLPFARWRRWSMFRREERGLAIRALALGPAIRWGARRATGVIVQTRWMKDALVSQARVDAERVVVVTPNAVITETAQPGEGRDATKYWQITDSIRLFYPTSAVVYKNIETLLCATAEMIRSNHPVEVVLTIRGTENAYARRMLRLATSLGDCVHFVGQLPREVVVNELRESILVFPSYIETFGLPLLEARSVGGKVVASDTPFAHEVLDGYRQAWFFPVGSSAGLASAILEASQASSGTVDLPTAFPPDARKDSWASVVELVRAASSPRGR